MIWFKINKNNIKILKLKNIWLIFEYNKYNHKFKMNMIKIKLISINTINKLKMKNN